MPNLVFATKGEAAVLRAQEDMKKQAQGLAAELKKDEQAADKARTAILKIYESVKTPQEQLKQRMEVLRKAIKDGTAPPEAITALERLKAKYQETYGTAQKEITKSTLSAKELDKAHRSALNADRVQAWGSALTVAAAPALKIAQAFRDIAAEQDKLAQSSRAAITGEGQLAQFANTPEDMQTLLRESRSAYASGVGRDRNTAAGALAGMLGADISNPQDRLTLMRMQSSGLLDNAGEVAKAAKTLQSTYGGELLPMLDRAFGAGDIAPGGASQLLIASSRSALTAKALGMVPDEVIGGTAALAQATGSESEGATLFDALLRALDKAGGFKGKSLNQAVNEITERVAKGENLRGDKLLGGRAEAVRAYRYFAGEEGAATYKRALIGSYQGVQDQAALSKLQLAEISDPNLRAGRLGVSTEQAAEVTQRALDEAAFKNVVLSLRNEQREAINQQPWGVRQVERAGLAMAEIFDMGNSTEQLARDLARETPFGEDTPAKREARATIEAIDKQRAIQEKMLSELKTLNNKATEGGIVIGGD